MIEKWDRIEIYTDGACKNNLGVGGWGAVLKCGEDQLTMKGHCKYTTNNRMEMMAAIRALQAIKNPRPITIYTDSQYLKNGITGWIHRWQKTNWRTANNAPVKNVDLWKELYELTKKYTITWKWVKGHNGNPGNELADKLANEGVQFYRVISKPPKPKNNKNKKSRQ